MVDRNSTVAIVLAALSVVVLGNYRYSVGMVSFAVPEVVNFANLAIPTPTVTSTNDTDKGGTISQVLNGTTTSSLESKNTQQQQQQQQQKTNDRRFPVIDIISIGSWLQQDLQNSQSETFGSHPAVRHFHRVTESDDSETNCHSNLTLTHLEKVVRFCKGRRDWPTKLGKMRRHYATLRWLHKKKNPAGWLCAQKRPMDGFLGAIDKYQYQVKENLPDYLLIGDDDTWFNVDKVLSYIPKAYPPQRAHAVAGCMIRSRVNEHNFTIPFGGYGLILTRAVLENFVRPIDCSKYEPMSNTTTPPAVDEEFEKLACWRVAQDGAGEQHLFRNGMSVANLMQAYSKYSPYMEVDSWGRAGFCMHSDWTWGYFINYYHLARHTVGEVYFKDVLEDRMEGYNMSQFYAGRMTDAHWRLMRECYHDVGFHKGPTPTEEQYCTVDAHLCHRLSPQHMHYLYNQTTQGKAALS